jgi:hypothetical protein
VHLSVGSLKPLDRLLADLEAACAAAGLKVAGVTKAPAGTKGSFVVELADPLPEVQADGDARALSTYRVAGYEVREGGTRLSTMRPSQLVDLLGHPEHAAAAATLERRLEAVLSKAAGAAPAGSPPGTSPGPTPR